MITGKFIKGLRRLIKKHNKNTLKISKLDCKMIIVCIKCILNQQMIGKGAAEAFTSNFKYFDESISNLLKSVSKYRKFQHNRYAFKIEEYIDKYHMETYKLSEEDGGGYMATIPTLGLMGDGKTLYDAIIDVRNLEMEHIVTVIRDEGELPPEDKFDSSKL